MDTFAKSRKAKHTVIRQFLKVLQSLETLARLLTSQADLSNFFKDIELISYILLRA